LDNSYLLEQDTKCGMIKMIGLVKAEIFIFDSISTWIFYCWMWCIFSSDFFEIRLEKTLPVILTKIT